MLALLLLIIEYIFAIPHLNEKERIEVVLKVVTAIITEMYKDQLENVDIETKYSDEIKLLTKQYDGVLDYDDIEIKYSDKIRQFYFLRIEFDDTFPLWLEPVYYDIMTGEEIRECDLGNNGFRHFSKKIILPDERSYTVEELAKIYDYVLDNKEMYVTNELNENVDGKIDICADRVYFSDELDFVYDPENEEYKYIVTGSVPNWLRPISSLPLKDTYNKNEVYNAVTGEIITKEELDIYFIYDKSKMFAHRKKYSVKLLKNLLNVINKGKQKQLELISKSSK